MRGRKGIVGIEAAIVLIAFVIVAAALAFVALNMGLFTTQKSKEVMQRGLEEATSALEVDGSVIAHVATGSVDAVAVPLKVSPGREGVDMSVDKATVRVMLPSGFYENAYCGVFDGSTLADSKLSTIINDTTIDGACTAGFAYLVIFNGDGDSVLEHGEKGLLVMELPASLNSYDEFKVEIRPIQGAALTVERMIPASLPTDGAVSLG